MNYKNYLLIAGLLFGSVELHAAFASSASTSAGVLERTIEKEYNPEVIKPKRDIPVIEVDIPEEQFDMVEGQTVHIEAIVLEGNEVIKTRKLQAITAQYEHRDLSMKDVRELCLKLRAFYVEEGYFLARAYAPVQDIKDSRLTIAILEGKLGNIVVEGNKHYPTKFVTAYFQSLQGKALHYDQFFRELLLLNDNQDLSAAAIFEKGKAFGTADVIIKVIDHRPVHFYADVNNYGASSTSLYRIGGRLDYGNLLINGDKLRFAEVVGAPVNSLRFTDVIYTFPITKTGWSGEVAYLYTLFKVQTDRELHQHGMTMIATAKVSYALQRKRRLSTDVFLEFDYKNIKNYAQKRTQSEDLLRVFSLGTDINYYDNWKGNNYWDVVLYAGVPDFLDGLHAVDHRCSRHRAGARYYMAYGDWKRVQELPLDFFFIFNFSGQYTRNYLPISEQFYIGGEDTVRGFPLAELLGDCGYYVNAEFRIPPPFRNSHIFGTKRTWKETIQFVLFVDNGGVYLKRSEKDQHKQSRGFASLSAAGGGIRIYGPWHFDFSLDVGIPISERFKSSNSITYWKVNWNPF